MLFCHVDIQKNKMNQDFYDFQRQMAMLRNNLVPAGTVRLRQDPARVGITQDTDYPINSTTIPTYDEPLYRENVSATQAAALPEKTHKDRTALVPLTLMAFFLIYLYTRQRRFSFGAAI